jgi:hypothetical protein
MPNETKQNKISAHRFHQPACRAQANLYQPSRFPYENTAKYLGMTLDTKRRWKPHVKNKTGRTQSEIQKKLLATGSLFCPIYIQ